MHYHQIQKTDKGNLKFTFKNILYFPFHSFLSLLQQYQTKSHITLGQRCKCGTISNSRYYPSSCLTLFSTDEAFISISVVIDESNVSTAVIQ